MQLPNKKTKNSPPVLCYLVVRSIMLGRSILKTFCFLYKSHIYIEQARNKGTNNKHMTDKAHAKGITLRFFCSKAGFSYISYIFFN